MAVVTVIKSIILRIFAAINLTLNDVAQLHHQEMRETEVESKEESKEKSLKLSPGKVQRILKCRAA